MIAVSSKEAAMFSDLFCTTLLLLSCWLSCEDEADDCPHPQTLSTVHRIHSSNSLGCRLRLAKRRLPWCPTKTTVPDPQPFSSLRFLCLLPVPKHLELICKALRLCLSEHALRMAKVVVWTTSPRRLASQIASKSKLPQSTDGSMDLRSPDGPNDLTLFLCKHRTKEKKKKRRINEVTADAFPVVHWSSTLRVLLLLVYPWRFSFPAFLVDYSSPVWLCWPGHSHRRCSYLWAGCFNLSREESNERIRYSKRKERKWYSSWRSQLLLSVLSLPLFP